MTTTFTNFAMISRDISRSLDGIKKQPAVQREVAYFVGTISKIKSVDEFVSNRRLVNFAMTAFGLEDMAFATAFIRKILNEGHDDRSAFVNKLADQRYLDFAKTFDFKRYGGATTTFDAVQKNVVERYVRQTLESQSGNMGEGVRLALYFERMAPEIGYATQILSDKALTQVTKTVLRLPDAFSLIDIDKQIEILEERMDFAELKDVGHLGRFLKRFSILWDLDHGASEQAPIVNVLGRRSGFGISEALLSTLSGLKRGS